MTVIGSGVDHDSLVFQVKKMYVKDGAPVPTEKSVYHGGKNKSLHYRVILSTYCQIFFKQCLFHTIVNLLQMIETSQQFI